MLQMPTFQKLSRALTEGETLYLTLYGLMILFFSYFWVATQFNPLHVFSIGSGVFRMVLSAMWLYQKLTAPTRSPEFEPPKIASLFGSVRPDSVNHSAAEMKSSNV